VCHSLPAGKCRRVQLDPNRIAAIGASSGGHLVALLGTADESAEFDVGEHLDQSSRVQAVVAMAPPSDLTRNFRMRTWN